MKKYILSASIVVALASCGGFSDEQGKAADEMCECIENDPYGDFDINWFECENELKKTYGTEIFEEGSWLDAIEEKCPEIAEKLD